MPVTTERIDIRALSERINRKPNTIRKWERAGVLPKRLLPHRDDAQRRYWTPSQVTGIESWMRKNDMRPGNTITDPSREAEHIAHLRMPKKLNGHNIRSARQMAEHGKTLEQILYRVHKNMKKRGAAYSSTEALERALRQVAAAEGWKLPKRKRRKMPRLPDPTRKLAIKLNRR